MAVPKKRHSHHRQSLRRSHHALKKVSYATCSSCGMPTLPHRVCPECHSYKGKQVLPVAE